MDLQYPVGKFTWNRTGEGLLSSEAERAEWLAEIEATPRKPARGGRGAERSAA